MHSYTYALVKDSSVNRDKKSPTFPGSLDSGNNTYILDYIQVRSGCACVIEPPPKEKNKENKNLQNKEIKTSKKNHKSHKKKPHHRNHNRNKNEQIPLLPRDDTV